MWYVADENEKPLRFTFTKHTDIWCILPNLTVIFSFKMINIGWLCYTLCIDWC